MFILGYFKKTSDLPNPQGPWAIYGRAVNKRAKAEVNSKGKQIRAIPDLMSTLQPLFTGGCPDILVLVVATHHCIYTELIISWSSRRFVTRMYSQWMNVGVHFLALICQNFNHQYWVRNNSPNFCPLKFLAIQYFTTATDLLCWRHNCVHACACVFFCI